MNPYAERVPTRARIQPFWWLVGLWLAIVAFELLRPPAIEVADRFKEICAVIGGAR